MKSLFFISLFLLSVFSVFAQKAKHIEILNANSIEIDRRIKRDVKRLLGDVQFKQGNALMFCDSAYLNTETNSFEAFSHVHIKQGDSLDLYADYLNYDGNIKLAQMRKNVRMIHGASILTTNFLDFDRLQNVAYYYNGGTIVDSINHLTSDVGYYYVNTKDYYAVSHVKLLNPDYVMNTDSLRYNIISNISYFYGPTTIISDSNFIYCENGWYNTQKNLSQYNKNAYLKAKGKKLSGDSLFYNRNLAYGEAFRNVALVDTAEHWILSGDYAVYSQNDDRVLVTRKALMTKIDNQDSLFLHADTLISYPVYNVQQDTLKDTLLTYSDTLRGNFIDTSKIILAYHHVQLYKKDFQIRCDSLTYGTKDSTIRMFSTPILWAGDGQLTADSIRLLMANNKPYKAILKHHSFAISQVDSTHYHQLKGEFIDAYFDEQSQLKKVNVLGEAKTIYFPTEETENDTLKGVIVGVNITKSEHLTLFFKNKNPYKITMYDNPEGVLNPLNKLPENKMKLEGFLNLLYLRPLSKNDIFIWKIRVIN